MKAHIFIKNYLAIASGILNEKSGIIDAPIARKENSIIERCVNNNGEIAITKYSVIKEFNDMSLIYITLQTGRTHQIRVHFSYIGYPLIGDTLYGTNSPKINRQALHAYKVTFIHPILRKKVTFKAPLPEDMKNLIM